MVNLQCYTGVHTYKELPNFEELLQIALNNAPRITGSEGDCRYTIVDLQKGISSSYPCTKCPIYIPGCKSMKKHRCPGISSGILSIEDLKRCLIRNLPNYSMTSEISGYYDRCKIVITDMHGLRDKSKEETLEEFRNLVKYLKNVYNKTFEVEVITKNIK